jgi:hypothetical protein
LNRRPTQHILTLIVIAGAGCARPAPPPPPQPKPAIDPNVVKYVDAIRLDDRNLYPSPTSQPNRFVKTSRAKLEWEAGKGLPGGHASLLFYMGSDDAHDFFYIAHHTFGRFYGVPRAESEDLQRTPLTADSLSWRLMPRPSSRPAAPTDAATNPSP